MTTIGGHDGKRTGNLKPGKAHSAAPRPNPAFLILLMVIGCQAKTEPPKTETIMSGLTVVSPALDGLLTSVQAVNQQLAGDSVITIYCEAEQVQCHYPDGFKRDQWGCVINHDMNADGLIDRNQAIYGAEAEARLAQCVRQP